MIKQLSKCVREFKKESILSMFFITLEVLLEVVITLVMAYLIDKGMNKILKKVGEEATEVIIAAKDKSKQDTIFEIADVMYHMSVMMQQMGITWDDIEDELQKRD